jgi:purine-nucleoside phosphorylase
MATPHNSASKGDFAKTVLMPGDPLRAEFIAQTFLQDVRRVTAVRNVYGFTGTYKGKPVSVMASGMGMGSIGIYSYELYTQYDVENIIRVGSAGAYVPELKLFDVVLASAAYSESTYARTMDGYGSMLEYPSLSLNKKIEEAAAKLGIVLHEGTVHSGDVFYHTTDDYLKGVKENRCLCAEMESFALFHNARATGRNAACLLTISDSLVTHQETTAEERQKSFTDMMKVALEAAV